MMKKAQLTLLCLFSTSSLLVAGGDITPVTPYEVEDVKAAQVVPVTPTPTVTPTPAPAVKLPLADISPLYVGLGLVAARYDAKCATTPTDCTVDKTGGVLIRGGYDFNQYLGLEVRGMITNLKDNGGSIRHVGAFVKPMYPLTDALNTYGLVGFAKTTTQGSMRITDVAGLAFGAGLEYDLSQDKKKDAKYNREFDGKADQEKGFGVFADYERLYYKSGSPDLDAVSIGLTYDF